MPVQVHSPRPVEERRGEGGRASKNEEEKEEEEVSRNFPGRMKAGAKAEEEVSRNFPGRTMAVAKEEDKEVSRNFSGRTKAGANVEEDFSRNFPGRTKGGMRGGLERGGGEGDDVCPGKLFFAICVQARLVFAVLYKKNGRTCCCNIMESLF